MNDIKSNIFLLKILSEVRYSAVIAGVHITIIPVLKISVIHNHPFMSLQCSNYQFINNHLPDNEALKF